MATRDNEFRICHRPRTQAETTQAFRVNRRPRQKRRRQRSSSWKDAALFILLIFIQSLLFGDCHATPQTKGISIGHKLSKYINPYRDAYVAHFVDLRSRPQFAFSGYPWHLQSQSQWPCPHLCSNKCLASMAFTTLSNRSAKRIG